MKEEARLVQTVTGAIAHTSLGIADAHNHIWISMVSGADPSAPVLNNYQQIKSELKEYRAEGGTSLLDCQPGGCGRDGRKLAALSVESGVNIIASTGFHRRKYYPPDYWLFNVGVNQIADHLINELHECLEECRDEKEPVRAGFIKIALEADWDSTPQAALEAAAGAAVEIGSLIEIHTEKGALAEKAIIYFEDRHVLPGQLCLCHMDKRPDFGLHSEIARYGALLEYDTFYRPKYHPEQGVWPLIQEMTAAGMADSLALATDMAEKELYTSIGGGPGLASLPREIRSRLEKMQMTDEIIRGMLGDNIDRRLAGIN
jgi:predicted metal-dependent phosphotriesterase family hydrolase